MTISKHNCPPGCAGETGFPVYGSNSFHEKSSICRAAIFAGIIEDDEGGEVAVMIAKGAKSYG
jgi:hypothetical protein